MTICGPLEFHWDPPVMQTVILTVHIIACIVMTGLVLLQKSEGGGLGLGGGGGGGGAGSLMSGRGAAAPLLEGQEGLGTPEADDNLPTTLTDPTVDTPVEEAPANEAPATETAPEGDGGESNPQ
jgi:preprotein translocase subunit SecG